MRNRNTVAGLVAGVVLALAGGAVAKEWPGFSVGMGMGGWLTNYKRFNVLPENKRLDITKGDLAHFDTYITEGDVQRVKMWGFDHIRLGFDQIVLEEAPGKYRERTMRKLVEFVGWCRKHKVNAVLNLHKAIGNYCDIPEKKQLLDTPELQDRFVALWLEIERRFHDAPEVAFELLNEVRDVDPAKWNRLADRTLKAIREVNPDRWVVIGSTCWNSPDKLAVLQVWDDPRVVYTFHMYNPHHFTHQRGVLQAGPLYQNDEVPYPGTAFVRKALKPAVDWAAAHPDKILWNGEFGTIGGRHPVERVELPLHAQRRQPLLARGRRDARLPLGRPAARLPREGRRGRARRAEVHGLQHLGQLLRQPRVRARPQAGGVRAAQRAGPRGHAGGDAGVLELAPLREAGRGLRDRAQRGEPQDGVQPASLAQEPPGADRGRHARVRRQPRGLEGLRVGRVPRQGDRPHVHLLLHASLVEVEEAGGPGDARAERARAAGEERVRNARELLAKMSELQKKYNCPVVGGGDLNCTRAHMEKGLLTPLPDWEKAGYADAQYTVPGASPYSSNHGDPRRDAVGNYRGWIRPEAGDPKNSLDHVHYTTNGVTPIALVVDRAQDALEVSDHSPVIFTFKLAD